MFATETVYPGSMKLNETCLNSCSKSSSYRDTMEENCQISFLKWIIPIYSNVIQRSIANDLYLQTVTKMFLNPIYVFRIMPV